MRGGKRRGEGRRDERKRREGLQEEEKASHVKHKNTGKDLTEKGEKKYRKQ